jgi:hypothetical protein
MARVLPQTIDSWKAQWRVQNAYAALEHLLSQWPTDTHDDDDVRALQQAIRLTETLVREREDLYTAMDELRHETDALYMEIVQLKAQITDERMDSVAVVAARDESLPYHDGHE